MSCMSLSQDEQINELLFVGFNQDQSCFACGTDNGFRIFTVDPYRETFKRIFSNGGIGIVEMLFKCNLLALVGGGRNPRYPPNKVMIWDDNKNQCIGEMMFKTEVKAVKLRRDRIVVALTKKVYVYRFTDLSLLDQINTDYNPKGLISLCPDTNHTTLACLGLSRGLVRVEMYDLKKATILSAHNSEVAIFSLNSDGSLIATASEKGTVVRIWNCITGDLQRELRRGADKADIYCIAFNMPSTYLACSSDKGTVHIFSLNEAIKSSKKAADGQVNGSSSSSDNGTTTSTANTIPNSVSHSATTASSASPVSPPSFMSSSFNFVKGFVPSSLLPKYIDSQWSYAQIHGLERRNICAFDKEDSDRIMVLIADGSFLTASFKRGGECERLTYTKFLGQEETSPLGLGLGLGTDPILNPWSNLNLPQDTLPPVQRPIPGPGSGLEDISVLQNNADTIPKTPKEITTIPPSLPPPVGGSSTNASSALFAPDSTSTFS